MMPSQTFLALANSQFELLSNSVQYQNQNQYPNPTGKSQHPERKSKIKTIALYLPQENPKTGQLEFMPTLVYPSHPKSERIFIASDAQSGVPPTVPPTLTQLPGFAHAATLLPAYPFSSSVGEGTGTGGVIGTPEEVFCDLRSGQRGSSSTALSLPLFSGPQTIGTLIIWGVEAPLRVQGPMTSMWTPEDTSQISRVGETLALALCMDSERFQNRIHAEEIRVAMADNLHQVKNPIQALSLFSKLLQRNLATDGGSGNVELSRLADNMVIQSERVVDLLVPFDSILNSMDSSSGDNKDGLNSYQRLLAPMERRELVLRKPRNKDNSYQGSLVQSEGNTSTSPLSSRSRIIGNGEAKDEKVKLHMSFIPDVLQPILPASMAIATDLGVDMKIYGAEEDNELPGVSVSPKFLQEAVVNVLDNAIKYVSFGQNGVQGMENSNPIIRVTLCPNGDDLPPGVTILVEDNGPGIPIDDRDAVFQRGYRGAHTNLLTNGSGIGLHISQALIAKMGGSLELLDNQTDHLQGTVMRFVLYRKPKIQ